MQEPDSRLSAENETVLTFMDMEERHAPEANECKGRRNDRVGHADGY
jgi:hypothetical protein